MPAGKLEMWSFLWEVGVGNFLVGVVKKSGG
jgi:hypothetical protein